MRKAVNRMQNRIIHVDILKIWLLTVILAFLFIEDCHAETNHGSTALPAVSLLGQDENSLDVKEELRDPFWPVGYMPKAKAKAVDDKRKKTADQEAREKEKKENIKRAFTKLRVGGVFQQGNKKYTTVNGIVVQKGDTVPVEMENGSIVRFKVIYIDLKRIQFVPVED